MKNTQKIIGYILLFPPILSVLLFTINLLVFDCGDIVKMYNLSEIWSGNVAYGSNGGGGGYTSAIPLYFGLMAIAGAYLIKDGKYKD